MEIPKHSEAHHLLLILVPFLKPIPPIHVPTCQLLPVERSCSCLFLEEMVQILGTIDTKISRHHWWSTCWHPKCAYDREYIDIFSFARTCFILRQCKMGESMDFGHTLPIIVDLVVVCVLNSRSSSSCRSSRPGKRKENSSYTWWINQANMEYRAVVIVRY